MRGRAAALAAALVLAAGASPALAQPLPSARIAELFAGRDAERKTRNGLPITITFHPGGRLEGLVRIGGVRDTGRWWTRDGKLCYQWRRLANARRSCVSVTREAGRIVVGSRWEGWDELEGWLARPSW